MRLTLRHKEEHFFLYEDYTYKQLHINLELNKFKRITQQTNVNNTM